MAALTLDALKSLLGVIEYSPSLVLWVRSLDFRSQLFISPTYTDIWGQKIDSLYEHPTSWNDYLYHSDYENVLTFCTKRMQFSDSKYQDKVLYRIKNTNNEIKYIKDIHFQLEDANQQIIAFAGLAQPIDERQWDEELKTNQSLESEHLREFNKFLSRILQDEKKIELQPKSTLSEPVKPPIIEYQGVAKDTKHPVILSRQEVGCLLQLMEGKSAKVTAAELNISSRTVEYHLNKVRQRMGCRSKLEIFKKIELKKIVRCEPLI